MEISICHEKFVSNKSFHPNYFWRRKGCERALAKLFHFFFPKYFDGETLEYFSTARVKTLRR